MLFFASKNQFCMIAQIACIRFVHVVSIMCMHIRRDAHDRYIPPILDFEDNVQVWVWTDDNAAVVAVLPLSAVCNPINYSAEHCVCLFWRRIDGQGIQCRMQRRLRGDACRGDLCLPFCRGELIRDG
jgi:hypothetical protein